MLRWSPEVARRRVSILPHVVDTLLLASAVSLALESRQFPYTRAWLAAKLFALPVYIGLALVALRYGKTKGVRASAWGCALLVFLYIVSVALTRDPLGFFTKWPN